MYHYINEFSDKEKISNGGQEEDMAPETNEALLAPGYEGGNGVNFIFMYLEDTKGDETNGGGWEGKSE